MHDHSACPPLPLVTKCHNFTNLFPSKRGIICGHPLRDIHNLNQMILVLITF